MLLVPIATILSADYILEAEQVCKIDLYSLYDSIRALDGLL